MKNNSSPKKLSRFTKNNPHCTVEYEKDMIVIDKLWGEDSPRIHIDDKDTKFINALNHIKINPLFDAIIHQDKNEIEFIYSYIDKNIEATKEISSREFDFHFRGVEYKCYFSKPTERLMRFAKYSKRIPSAVENTNTPAKQLQIFKDAQLLSDAPSFVRDYFVGKVPRSFFVTANQNQAITTINLAELCRHINFVLDYYDRRAPSIVVRSEETEEATSLIKPKRYIEHAFPPAISIQPIDDIILQLIEVARQTQPRFAFVYYYQVFEYAGYYYIDSKARTDLALLLKDPSLISCSDDKIAKLFSCLSELNHDDDAKMRKVVEEYCNPSEIWEEIENNKNFFAQELSFNGGFKLAPLISKDTTKDAWRAMWMPKLYDQLTKIRNCLVHAREKRHKNVILPTKQNHTLIRNYLPVIRRTAEQIALRSTKP